MTLIPFYNVGYLWKCESTWGDDPQDIEIGYLEGTYTNDPGLLVHFIIFGYLKPWVLTIPPYRPKSDFIGRNEEKRTL